MNDFAKRLRNEISAAEYVRRLKARVLRQRVRYRQPVRPADTPANDVLRVSADRDQALDAAARALAGFVCRHKPPCQCTKGLLSEVLPSTDPSDGLSHAVVTVYPSGQGRPYHPRPEPGYFDRRPISGDHPGHLHPQTAYACVQKMEPVRVFREEDVLPLYDVAVRVGSILADTFPAPDNWRCVNASATKEARDA